MKNHDATQETANSAPGRLGLAGGIARYFLNNQLTPLLVVAALLLGVFAVLLTPREEDPQIKVPMVDIFVPLPGAAPREVEQRICTPLEKLLWEIPGVEYVYSTAAPDMGMVIVRFKVGWNEDTALVRIYDKINGHFAEKPEGSGTPLVKLHSIDDVPVLAVTLWGPGRDAATLTRLAQEVEINLRQVPDVAAVELLGAQPRQIRVLPDPVRLAAHQLDPLAVVRALQTFSARLPAGSLLEKQREIRLDAGSWLTSRDDVAAVLVGVRDGRPVRLGDVAAVVDGPALPDQYVIFGTGAAGHAAVPGQFPAVTLTVGKRPGVNATALNHVLHERLQQLHGTLLPADVRLTVVRDYGKTAGEKASELISHLLLATVSVTALIAIMLGLRASLVVGIAVPVTLALTLLVYYLCGYTLNRVTLFALIFSIGILVDDAIVVVENVYRHFRQRGGGDAQTRAVAATDEVGNPTILATITVIAAILPMAFVGGLMGPYMRPIPVGASAAMLISLAVAFMVTPWAAVRLLRRPAADSAPVAGKADGAGLANLYRRVMGPLVRRPVWGITFLAALAVALLLSLTLVPLKWVRMKMLPFDNKSEFQIMVDMPAGTPLEGTLRAAQTLARRVATLPEVTHYQIYAGNSAPVTFNGLVRHYYLRRQANQADIQVNLLPKGERRRQSHDLAKEARTLLEPLARELGVALKVVEIPPGPPVLSTLVAEVYGPELDGQLKTGHAVLDLFQRTDGVVDADIFATAPQEQIDLAVDPERAATAGLGTAEIATTLAVAAGGQPAVFAHLPDERDRVPVVVRLPRASRQELDALLALRVTNREGRQVPLAAVVTVHRGAAPQAIYHKNLRRVVYVVGDVAGREESPVYAILKLNRGLADLPRPDGGKGVELWYVGTPPATAATQVKWDGEWQVTYEVFRDMGIAFAIVLVLIYVLVVGWFRSYLTPLAIMAPIPLSLIGILPAHALTGMFFTATSMIGFIALAGIVVRNSILLIDFAELKMAQGMPMTEAVIEGGAERFRPMLLTAMAVVVGAGVILFDPIFQGLALALISGELASTFLARGAVPVLYALLHRRTSKRPEA